MPTSHSHDQSSQYTDLHAFQRDCLLAIALIEADQDRPPSGVRIREWLRDHYEESLNHSRVYQNLNVLAEAGLIEKGQRTDRTNTYATTEQGRELLSDRFDQLTTALGRLQRPAVGRESA